MDPSTVQDAIDKPTSASKALLFANLANSKAALRARAADGLLKLYAKKGFRAGLARDFGMEPEAILTQALDELRELIDEPRTDAWARFTNSLAMTYDAWRDGAGYDLDALKEMSEIERGAIRELVKTRLGHRNRPADWRDLEAAKALDETQVLRELTTDASADTRLRAKELLGDATGVADELCATLLDGAEDAVISRSIDLVPAYRSPAVKRALIARVRKLDSHFINAAMVLLETFGGVEDSWSERPFLFRVQSEGAHGPSMQALLARIAD